MRYFTKFMYYLKRGGVYCALSILRQKFRGGIFMDDDDIMGNRFYEYFENLSETQYAEELKQQLKLFVKNGSTYNIDDPTTFNEKIQWLKIHDSTELKTMLADKYAVRKWIESKIGGDYLIPLVGGPWQNGWEIDFDKLPDKFVLKANHACGRNLIIKDKRKVDRQEIISIVNKWMKTLYGWRGMETHYFSIDRKIIAEQYIEQMDGNLLDYKIYCHNGEPLYFQMIGDRNFQTHEGRLAFYDTEWNLCDFNTGDYPEYEHDLEKPKHIRELLDIARILSKDFIYVRVDLYVLDERIYFGEMTFTPGNGFLPWKPADANVAMGKKLILPID